MKRAIWMAVMLIFAGHLGMAYAVKPGISATPGATENLGGGDNNGGGQKIDTDTQLGIPPGQLAAGGTVTFTATVTAQDGGLPTGIVTFTAANLFSGAAPLIGNAATFTTDALGAGHHVVIARYEGDGTFRDSQGNLAVEIEADNTPAPATLALSGLQSIYDGASHPVSVTTSPAGLSGVQVTYDGSLTPPTEAGRYTVVAALDNPRYAAPAIAGTLVIDKAPAILTLGPLHTVYNGNPQPVAITVEPAGLSGISLRYAGSPTAPTNAGTYPIQVTLDNPNYQADPANGNLVIDKAATASVLSVSASLIQLGQPLTLTARVSSLPPGGGVPQGNVSFFCGQAPLGTAPLNGGVATLTTTALPGGVQALSVRYAGSENHLESISGAVSVKVNRSPDLTAIRPSIGELWPPNHKMVNVDVLGVVDPDGDAVTLRIDAITQDEPTNGTGDGDTGPDATGLGAAAAQLRAERAGTAKAPGNGRVYMIWLTTTDNAGGVSKGKVAVRVPLDQNPRQAPVDDGQRYNAVNGQPFTGLAKPLVSVVPADLSLGNYPNPFNPTTTISYHLAEAVAVRLTIFNALGQQVRVLADETQDAGPHILEWNGLDMAGQAAAGGIYFYRLEAGTRSAVGKMLFAK